MSPLYGTFSASSSRGFGGRLVSKGKLGTASNPANNGREIFAADSSSPTGIYWLKSASGTAYQAYINMDQGGGWIRVNAGSLGPYSNPISSRSTAPTNVNLVTGGSTQPFEPLNGPTRTPYHTGCNGATFASRVDINSTFRTDLGITQTRFNVTVDPSSNNVVCGFVGSNLASPVLINGTASMIAVCDNTPRRYGDVNPPIFTFEAYGTIPTESLPEIWHTWTACGANMTVKINDIWVR
jgi:hypothetical protein